MLVILSLGPFLLLLPRDVTRVGELTALIEFTAIVFDSYGT